MCHVSCEKVFVWSLRALSFQLSAAAAQPATCKLFAFQTFVDDIFHENFNVFSSSLFFRLGQFVPGPTNTHTFTFAHFWYINICRAWLLTLIFQKEMLGA